MGSVIPSLLTPSPSPSFQPIFSSILAPKPPVMGAPRPSSTGGIFISCLKSSTGPLVNLPLSSRSSFPELQDQPDFSCFLSAALWLILCSSSPTQRICSFFLSLLQGVSEGSAFSSFL